jgi:DNA ligase-associated metallophosphoesterase
MQKIALAGQTVALLAGGAAFLPEWGTLLVADAHFGKAVSFRRLGVPVPQGTTSATLEALTGLVRETGAGQIVFLGDFLHSARAHAAGTLDALVHWRDAHADLQLTLVRGNHDLRAGDPPASLGLQVVDEPLMLGGLALCHHPQVLAGAYTLAGHWHPCVTLSGKARERLRLPCFWLGDESTYPVGVLPAFGAFTGMHPIDRRSGDRVFVLAGADVRQLP